MRLEHPLLLLTAVAVLAAIALSLRRGAPPRRWPFAGRCLALALIVLALSGPELGHGSSGATVLVLERTQGVSPAAARLERRWLREAGADGCAAECKVVQFAGQARLTPSAAGLLPPAALGGSESDLEGALQLALAKSPGGGRVVLLARSAAGAGALAAQARAAGRRIDTVTLPEGGRDAAVTRLQAPGDLHAGDPLALEATISSTVATAATVTLLQDGLASAHQRLHLDAGENPLLLSLKAPAAGEHSYQLRVSIAHDRLAANDALATTVHVTAQPSVLLATGGSPIASILTSDGIHVTSVAPSALPSSAGSYSAYDAVVLDDASAGEIGAGPARALAEAVHAGTVGLLALGGHHSFSLGGYYSSPLQQALPVSSLRPGNQQQRQLGVELVLDRSGSMIDEAGGLPKLEMAQVASIVATRYLAEQDDQLGVVDFDIAPHVLVPVTKLGAPATTHEVEKRIEGLIAEGGTNIYKALAEGARQIEASHEPQRHIVLITDGVSEPGSYKSLLPQLRREHITVSTVALGSEADFALLKAIAHETGGQYHAAANAGELPRIFAKETRVKARPVSLHGQIAVSAGAPTPILASVAEEALAPVSGNVVTTLKPGAEAGLLGHDPGHEDDPLLAQWQYGLGRVATWTPGLKPEWAASWSDRDEVWQDALRWVERGVAPRPLTPQIAGPGTSELRIDTIQSSATPLDLAELTGTLSRPGAAPVELAFEQTAPSEYVARVPALAAGVHSYTISDQVSSQQGLLAVPYPAVDRPLPASATGLGALAGASGGRPLAADAPSALGPAWTSLWRWLALAALLVFLTAAIAGLRGDRGGPPRRRATRAGAGHRGRRREPVA